ncbi:cardiolipin synthase [Desulfosporosinus acididurans]|uniref:phospholipase D n=2 Tax=Desulfosporosinus acididurans TaxID=476652 RepID=A0A0J1ITA4_9FIRM|nr:phosphatidylserine/phosphatidylglycerophosphate/cardiolipin synthase family protein [Desulfosporosinus acididurans]KLU67876.1 cardiolipin synthase [Desulfosporosinus acididurans]
MPKRHIPLVTIVILLFCLLFLSGCTMKVPKIFAKKAPISNLSAEALLIDQEAIYQRTISLIQSAQSSIYVEQAEFDDPQLINLLLSKSRSGIEVHILLDQWQKQNWATLDQLKNQNVSIQYYPAQKGQNDHTKWLIVDQNKALVYGPSWTSKSFKAHDLAVELSGSSAWKIAALFSKDWEFTTTFPLDVPKPTTLNNDNITLAVNANVKEQLLEYISSSAKSIWIENTEITEPDIVQALFDAAGKGRNIRIILDSSAASKTPVTLEKLKAAGISIRYFPKQSPLGLHLAIFDQNSFLASGSDWTRYNFVADHEFSITVPSPAATSKLDQMFQEDWKKSSP